ncbi:unnamed protein product, partial [Trichogramma brassicae]
MIHSRHKHHKTVGSSSTFGTRSVIDLGVYLHGNPVRAVRILRSVHNISAAARLPSISLRGADTHGPRHTRKNRNSANYTAAACARHREKQLPIRNIQPFVSRRARKSCCAFGKELINPRIRTHGLYFIPVNLQVLRKCSSGRVQSRGAASSYLHIFLYMARNDHRERVYRTRPCCDAVDRRRRRCGYDARKEDACIIRSSSSVHISDRAIA